MSEKYNHNRKLITIKCDFCGKEFQKPLTEYNRCQKLGRKSYCCRKHAIEGARSTRAKLPYKPASDKMLEHLKHICGNQRDAYTPFRYSLRCAKRRFKDVNITLDDLKEVWEEQNGICPYTGIKLILPEDSNINQIDFFHRASLDRIDSTKGYIKGNIQFISTPINLMKQSQTDLSVKTFLKEISNYTSTLIV
jgi:hypothetical protein